jgi:DNA repair exonuclease SbcCD ATPase subunit
MISNHLRIGDTCPVCSNRVIQKSYSETNDLSKIEGEIDRSISNVKLSHLERDKILANVISLKARYEFEKTQIEENLTEIRNLKEGKNKYYQRFVDNNDQSEENFKRLYSLLQKTSDSLEELIAIQDEIREAEKFVLVQKIQAGTKVTVYKNHLEKLIDIFYDLQKKQAEREFAISTVNERFEN